MKNYLIDFKNMGWETPAPGVRYKVYTHDNHKIRLVEFTEEFVEDDWCTKGHTGYILEGNLLIEFNESLSTFRAGDGFFIPEGEENRHKGFKLILNTL